MLTKVVTALALIFALSGCTGGGDDSSSDDSSSNSSSDGPSSKDSETTKKPLPACDGIWKEGEDLPEDYEGCGKGAAASLSEAVDCEGDRFLVIYDETFYAITGEEIKKTKIAPLQDTDEYTKAYDDCKDD